MPVLENARHENYVQNLIKGMSQRQAYRDVYKNNMTDKQVDEEACKLFNSPKVHQRYKELMQQLEDTSIMSAKERMKWLTDVIKNIQRDDVYVKNNDGEDVLIGSKNADINTKLKAIDTLNKMDNAYQQNVKISGSINNPFDGMSTEELRDILGKLEND